MAGENSASLAGSCILARNASLTVLTLMYSEFINEKRGLFIMPNAEQFQITESRANEGNQAVYFQRQGHRIWPHRRGHFSRDRRRCPGAQWKLKHFTTVFERTQINLVVVCLTKPLPGTFSLGQQRWPLGKVRQSTARVGGGCRARYAPRWKKEATKTDGLSCAVLERVAPLQTRARFQ